MSTIARYHLINTRHTWHRLTCNELI